jgi:hypothetical protein
VASALIFEQEVSGNQIPDINLFVGPVILHDFAKLKRAHSSSIELICFKYPI